MSTWFDDYIRRQPEIGYLKIVSPIVTVKAQSEAPHMQVLTDAEHLILKQLETITAQLQRIVILLEALGKRVPR